MSMNDLIDLSYMNKESWSVIRNGVDKSDLNNYLSRFSPKEFKGDFVDSCFRWYSISFNKNLVGSCWIDLEQNGEATIGVFIFESDRGKGIAHYLFNNHLLKIAKELDLIRLNLNVRLTNKRAIKLYEELGFQVIKTCQKENGIRYQKMSKCIK